MRDLTAWVALGALVCTPLLACDDDDGDGSTIERGGAAGQAGMGALGGSGGAAGGAGGATRGGATGMAGEGGAQAGMAGAAGAQAGAAGAAGALGVNCVRYCARVVLTCTGENAQYSNGDECRDVCAALPLGDVGDTTGNTVGCRLARADEAAEDASQCSAAGPAGAGTCGDNCEAYCTLMLAACPDEFGSEASCMMTCAEMAGADATTYGTETTGDNLQCRLYHAALATAQGPTPHCMHASATPTGPCAP